MTYEEAVKKISDLNSRGWAFTMTQGMGRTVLSEFSGEFVYHNGDSSGGRYADTFPELVEVTSKLIEEIESRWVAPKR